MTTAYTPILKLALPVTGELSGTWGTVVNDNITSMVEQAVAGLSTISTWTSGTAHTLTTADGTSSESRCAMLVLATGAGGTAITGAADLICPAASKMYVVQNGTAYAVTLKTSAGTGVAVPAGETAFLFCDGTNVHACVTTIVNGTISGNLTVNGNTTLGDAATDTITATGQFNTDLLPSTDNARDLGSTAKSWRTLYCDTSVLVPLVTATNVQVTNIKANDGTAAITIADSTGAVTVSTLLNVDNLRLETNTLSSTDTNGNINITPNGTGAVVLPLLRLSGSSSGYVGIQGAAAAGSTTYTLPAADGTSGQVLSTNGTGTLSWATASSGGTPGGSNTQIQFNDSGSFGGDADFTWNKTTNTLTINSINVSKGASGISTNLFIGTAAASTTGSDNKNVSLGVAALNSVTGGQQNVAVGWNALNGVLGGTNNVAIGDNAGALLTSASFNTAVGAKALDGATGGSGNVAVGYTAMTATVTGNYNTAVGTAAGQAITSGYNNVLMGYLAGGAITSGFSNTVVGNSALPAVVSNGYNVAVGEGAGRDTTGQQNTLVGFQAGYTLVGGSNNLVLGYNAVSSSTSVSNEITLGNSSIATLRCQVTTITALSDARDKKDVQDIPLGVSFIQRLHPVSFVWNTRDGGKVDVPEFGFIAQELQQAQADHGVTLPGLVHDINPERLEAAPGTLIPVLVKAVQELQAQIDELKRQLAARG